jgi:hypothetical protein
MKRSHASVLATVALAFAVVTDLLLSFWLASFTWVDDIISIVTLLRLNLLSDELFAYALACLRHPRL